MAVATGRDRDSILRRMAALRVPRGVEDDLPMDAQWFEHLRASATATEPPRAGVDDRPAHLSPWTTQVVKAINKCSGETQNDLCEERLVGNFLEWCDIPLIGKPGFSTTDGCWLFDEIEGNVRSVVPHADYNVYLSTPHPTGDLVMAADKDRVLDFFRTTFFNNAAALECQLAAICLCEARAFITVGPGGVGQSLTSCLIANLFGGSHGFMDTNVFCSLDESHVHHLGHENSRCPVFFCPIGPTVCSSRDRQRPGGPPAPTNGSAKTFTRR